MKISKKSRRTAIKLALCMIFAAAVPTAANAKSDYPDQNFRMVIPFGAGGGSDILARTIGGVIKDMKLLPRDIVYENLPGSSGARGYKAAASRKGDPYTLATVSVSFFTTPILGGAPFSLKDFTPIGAISMAPYAMMVKTDSKLKSLADVAKAGRLTTGTVGVVSDARLLADMVSRELKIKVDAVRFDGEGEIVSNVLGGHVDFMFGNLSEVMPQIEAGTMRAIAVSTGERLSALPDVPTFKESGYNVEHVMLRGLVMPAGVSPEVVAFWEEVLRKVAQSDEWKKKYLDRFKEEPRYENAQNFAVLLQQTSDHYVGVMKNLGIIK